MGGDEFAVLLPVIEDAGSMEAVAEKLLKELSAPFTVGRHAIQLGISIGMGFYAPPGNAGNTSAKG
jgi:predicted signal transduction protein with EAL and GGDEF domain